MYLNARRIYEESKQTQMILLAIEDVTERVFYKRHLEELVEEPNGRNQNRKGRSGKRQANR